MILRIFLVFLGFYCAFCVGMTSAHALESIKCQAKAPPKINVVPSNSKVKYDFTKTKEQLNQVDVDTISPYGPNHKTYVSGLMSGSIQVKSQIGFIQETYDRLGVGCAYLKSIDVEIHIDPTIFVASEYPKGSCMHNAVLTHEYKHVREDQLIVNKYANVIGKALASIVEARGPSFGPYEVAKIPVVQENVQKSFGEVLKRYNQQMNEERQHRQQGIDTLEEYQSIGKECKPQKRG